jgi:hypothetical protein
MIEYAPPKLYVIPSLVPNSAAIKAQQSSLITTAWSVPNGIPPQPRTNKTWIGQR